MKLSVPGFSGTLERMLAAFAPLTMIAVELSASRCPRRLTITSRLIADDDSRSQTASTRLKVSVSRASKAHGVQLSLAVATRPSGEPTRTPVSNA